jgi:hypothetical protein
MHTGEGISMRSIVARWPTLITDFMNMKDEDTDINKVADSLKVSRAEAVVLVTKNKLFLEWKDLFGPEIRNRYVRITELLRGRQDSIDKYRDWVKPYIARHKLLEEGLARPGTRNAKTTTQFETNGTATSSAQIVLYTWKDFLVPEIFKGGSESMGQMLFSKEIEVDDKWTKRNLIFGRQYGLINKYPWITEEWVAKQKEWMFNSSNRWLTKHKPYYSFFVIKLMRNTIRMPDGSELDDGVFDVNMIFMSQNAAFVKMLELKAKQEEMEQYVDGLLGVKKMPRGTQPGYSKKDHKEKKGIADEVTAFLEKVSLPLSTSWGKGPYERNFNDRITKIMLARCAQERYGPIVNFLKKKMGMG